ncbi:MAG: hypothetical protein JWM04_2601 [Verrucomicrobiales bacterium]|nr:hypothetical protein [Verrucomicrobiales bacterium]
MVEVIMPSLVLSTTHIAPLVAALLFLVRKKYLNLLPRKCHFVWSETMFQNTKKFFGTIKMN